MESSRGIIIKPGVSGAGIAHAGGGIATQVSEDEYLQIQHLKLAAERRALREEYGSVPKDRAGTKPKKVKNKNKEKMQKASKRRNR